MNSSDHQLAERILGKLQEVLANTLGNSENLKQSEQFASLLKECRRYTINPNGITEAQKLVGEIKDTADILNAAKRGRDEFFSTIANKMVERMMKDISVPFLDLTITNIEIKTRGKEEGVKFDIHIFSKTIKPFVQFVLVSPSVGLKKNILKISFQIEFNVGLSDCKIMSDKKEKKVSGNLDTTLRALITKLETPVGSVDTSINLGQKDFEVELLNLVLPVRG